MSNDVVHANEELLAAMQKLGRLLGSRRVSSRIADVAGSDVSAQGVQILRSLLRHGEQPIAGVAAAAHMDISAVSRQLRPLEESGLVKRSAAATDGRVALVSLTAKGRRIATRIREVGLNHLETSLADWSSEDTALLASLLGRLVDDMQRTEIVESRD